MKKNIIPSSFNSLPIEIFHYESLNKNAKTVILMKGLYGLHKPGDLDSWDNEIIIRGRKEYDFFVINTARLGETIQERSSNEAFIGKNFRNECDDFKKAFEFIFNQNSNFQLKNLSVVANSFGGTTLLGVPNILNLTQVVIMIGSGCGKSLTTTKPLLKTLYPEEKLLANMKQYKGVFAYIRGMKDTIVPKESQDKIIQYASNTKTTLEYIVSEANHELKIDTPNSKFNRANFILNTLKYLNEIF